MGFLGGYVTLISGFNDDDKKDAYYVIDEIKFNSDLKTNDIVEITITFNIYPSIDDRINRINLIGSCTFNRRISRENFSENVLQEYYVYCKPLIIECLRKDVAIKLDLDISDEIPSEYLEYYTLTDHT
tara:strand:- start:183 stop:566 length:384 start_codon:yes stop_codon:yes gene_type:complete